MNLAEALEQDASGWCIIMPTDTSPDNIEFTEAETEPSLKAMQEAVGGYIEHITLRYIVVETYDGENLRADFVKHREADGLVDEEGKLKGKPYNPLGTAWYGRDDDVIVGPLMVMLGAARMK
jgi:hypothetical protein